MVNIEFKNNEGETIVMPSNVYAPPSYPPQEDNTPFKTYHSKRKLQQMRKKKRGYRKNKN